MTIGRRAKIIELLIPRARGHRPQPQIPRERSDHQNDLGLLEERGSPSACGAIKTSVNIDYHLSEKSNATWLKTAIGKKTVEPSAKKTRSFSISTTTLEVAKNLSGFTNLTIITNALNVAGQLVSYPQIKLIMLGGMLRQSSLSMLGPVAEANIRDYYCDKLIMGVDSIDSRYGISTPTIEEAHLNRLMIDIAKEVIV
jgi:DeoR family transcriptional regulator of aga operon